MKKMLLPLLLLFLYAGSLRSMSYLEARDHARFLTDKMAYELNLNDEQYNYAYEINLDYLMSLNTASDVYSASLTYRNTDLRYILYDWQYRLFVAADYFFHPILWRSGVWHYPVYTRYNRGYFYYNAPRVYVEYRGGHHHVHHPHVSYYHNRRPTWHGGFRGEMRTPVGHRAPQQHHIGTRPGHSSHGSKDKTHNNNPNRPQNPVTPQRPSRPNNESPANRRPIQGPHASPSNGSNRRPSQYSTEKQRPQTRTIQQRTQRPVTERRSSTRTTVQQNRNSRQQKTQPTHNSQRNNQRPQR